MRPNRLIPLIIVAAALVPAAPATAQMRCGTRLIKEGDSVAKLLEYCGQPSVGEPERNFGTSEWLYDFGPTEFSFRVVIRDGKVEHIEDLGRGI